MDASLAGCLWGRTCVDVAWLVGMIVPCVATPTTMMAISTVSTMQKELFSLPLESSVTRQDGAADKLPATSWHG